MNAQTESSPWERRVIPALFVALLAFNFWAVSVGWKNLNLPGCEFRQAQTAVSAYFIQQDHDYSLAYPTPVLGTPWSIPMEFPLYQWTVAAISNRTGWSLTSTARGVSAFCFYAALPALYLLLGSLGFARGLRLLVLSFVLTCPLYIFYARAFMIETMALMAGAWYLCALVRAVEKKSLAWLLVCIAGGTIAGLVKVTTLLFFLLPAFVWSLVWLWRARPRRHGGEWRPLGRVFGWLVSAHVVPFAAAQWWVGYSDRVKMANPVGAFLTSSNLMSWNLGIGQRFSPVVWAAHWRIYFLELISPAAAVLCLIAAIFVGRRWAVAALASVALFLLVQFIFPVLYAWHEYYYVASAFTLMTAVGFIAAGVWMKENVPAWIPIATLGLLHALQIHAWAKVHYEDQARHGVAGSSLTALIKLVTLPDESIIVAGDDWNSMIPYYAERRALMLRDEPMRNPEQLDAALSPMKDQHVAVMVTMGQWRGHPVLRAKAAALLGIDPRPTLTWGTTDIYFQRDVRSEILEQLDHRGMDGIGDIAYTSAAKAREHALANREVTYASLGQRHRALFRTMQPAPTRFFSTLGPELWNENGKLLFFAHPDTRLWFSVSAGAHRLLTSIQLQPSAYTGVPRHEASDGVTLVATLIAGDGTRREIQQRTLNPRDNEADRGTIAIDWPFTSETGMELEVAVTAGPAGNAARDWTTLGPISIRRDAP
jgi:hypothetical protein